MRAILTHFTGIVNGFENEEKHAVSRHPYYAASVHLKHNVKCISYMPVARERTVNKPLEAVYT